MWSRKTEYHLSFIKISSLFVWNVLQSHQVKPGARAVPQLSVPQAETETVSPPSEQ